MSLVLLLDNQSYFVNLVNQNFPVLFIGHLEHSLDHVVSKLVLNEVIQRQLVRRRILVVLITVNLCVDYFSHQVLLLLLISELKTLFNYVAPEFVQTQGEHLFAHFVYHEFLV
jgi:hypothetical protein